MRKERRDGGMEEVKSFSPPASVRPYPAYTPGAVRHGDNFTSPQQAGAFVEFNDAHKILYFKEDVFRHFGVE